MYALAAVIPLWPYFMWSVSTALVVSLVATGPRARRARLVKGRVAGMALLRSGCRCCSSGGSAATGYLIGVLVPKLF
jgi:VIT1/CCC1 family predicted Fe2+/Mn2+ transporter